MNTTAALSLSASAVGPASVPPFPGLPTSKKPDIPEIPHRTFRTVPPPTSPSRSPASRVCGTKKRPCCQFLRVQTTILRHFATSWAQNECVSFVTNFCPPQPFHAFHPATESVDLVACSHLPPLSVGNSVHLHSRFQMPFRRNHSPSTACTFMTPPPPFSRVPSPASRSAHTHGFPSCLLSVFSVSSVISVLNSASARPPLPIAPIPLGCLTGERPAPTIRA